MRILMSAFACGPNKGSEPGVGWSWAIEAGRQGHTVTVLTQTYQREIIEQRIAQGRVPENVEFEFFMPSWLEGLRRLGLRFGPEGPAWLAVHFLWQVAAYVHLRGRKLSDRYDIIHHITYGGIRHPTLLGFLDVPLVLGPLGGGERAPMALRKSLSWRAWFAELVRDLHTWFLRFDPITRMACRNAIAVYTKTGESARALPAPKGRAVQVHPEIGTAKPPVEPRAQRGVNEPLRLIYVGRFVSWKGMAIGLRAVAEARSRGVDTRLTMVGAGPDEANWKRLASRLGLQDAVAWKGYVPHEELARIYRSHDALLFPSLHDSSGNVILEAFVEALPVICLRLGGPAVLVTETSGRLVDVDGRSEQDVVSGLADAMGEMAADPSFIRKLSLGATQRARRFDWSDVVRGLYADVEHRLAERRVARHLRDHKVARA